MNTSTPSIIKFAIAVLLVVIQISCQKTEWFDAKTSLSQTVPSTLTDYKALMDNADILNTSTPALGEWGSDGHVANESVFLFLGGNSINPYTWSHNIPYKGVVDWSSVNGGAYLRVFYSNLVLEGLSTIHPLNTIDQIEWNTIRAQTLFTRGRSFYELSQIFAPPYLASTASTDLSIPLRLQSDINIPSVRSTVKETYDQIISDLMNAKELLPPSDFPVTSYLKSRPTQTAIYALLARMYLSMEDYIDAGLYADSSLQLYNTLMDYNTLDSTSSSPVSVFGPEVILHTVMAGTMNQYFVYIDSTLYDEYDSNDLRKVIFYDISGGRGSIIFKGTYEGEGDIFSGLATDETYLIRSECYARAGNTSAAMADLNTLMKTRWRNTVTYPTITATDGNDALAKILTERKKELILRGLRWSDLRRLNRDDRFKMTLSRTYQGQTYTILPNSYQYTLPIPDDVIEMTGMKQNPGW